MRFILWSLRRLAINLMGPSSSSVTCSQYLSIPGLTNAPTWRIYITSFTTSLMAMYSDYVVGSAVTRCFLENKSIATKASMTTPPDTDRLAPKSVAWSKSTYVNILVYPPFPLHAFPVPKVPRRYSSILTTTFQCACPGFSHLATGRTASAMSGLVMFDAHRSASTPLWHMIFLISSPRCHQAIQ